MADLTRAEIIKLIAVATRPLNLTGVDLTGVDLSNLDLREANLSRANLSQANVKGTLFLKALLDETNFTKATGLEFSQMNLAHIKNCKGIRY